ncbi:spermidine/putrescine-binding protein [Bradyrhizobium sp. i1.4.4]
MSNFDRRSVLKAGLGGAALLAGPGIVPVRAAEWTNTPEPNASIRVLRWKQFIQAEFDKFAEQTKKFSEKTGVKIKLEAESWEDIRPKAAVGRQCRRRPRPHHRHARRSPQIPGKADRYD